MSVSLYREHGFPQTNSSSSKNFNSGHKRNLELKPWEASWRKQRWPSIWTSSGMTGRAAIFSAAARLSWPSAHFTSSVISAATKDSCFLILVSVCLVFPYSFIRPLSQPDRLSENISTSRSAPNTQYLSCNLFPHSNSPQREGQNVYCLHLERALQSNL